MKRAVALGVLGLLALASPAISQTPDDKLIVPGQRIGKWTLEMTMDSLLQMNGPRNTLAVVPGTLGNPVIRMVAGFSDSTGEIWWHEWSNLSFSAATRGRDAQRVEYIFTSSEDFKTDKGVAPGMVRAAVQNAYGQPSAVTRTGGAQNPGGLRMIYDESGIAATISRNGTAEMLFVFRPRTARTLWNF